MDGCGEKYGNAKTRLSGMLVVPVNVSLHFGVNTIIEGATSASMERHYRTPRFIT